MRPGAIELLDFLFRYNFLRPSYRIYLDPLSCTTPSIIFPNAVYTHLVYKDHGAGLSVYKVITTRYQDTPSNMFYKVKRQTNILIQGLDFDEIYTIKSVVNWLRKKIEKELEVVL